MVVAQRIPGEDGGGHGHGMSKQLQLRWSTLRVQVHDINAMAAFLNFINYSTLHLFSYGKPSITNGKSKEGMNPFKVSPIGTIV